VAGEPQPQIDIHEAVSFDGTETAFYLNLGFFFPFDETMIERLLRYQHQDWMLKD
jgi:hypothetical protein